MLDRKGKKERLINLSTEGRLYSLIDQMEENWMSKQKVVQKKKC